MSQQDFTAVITNGYSFKGESLLLGKAVLDSHVQKDLTIAVPLKTMNRHGLISGATGTGKTKTLQVLAEGLSNASVPVLMLDIKGDLSGIAAGGTENEKIKERVQLMGLTNYTTNGFPVELLSLSDVTNASPIPN